MTATTNSYHLFVAKEVSLLLGGAPIAVNCEATLDRSEPAFNGGEASLDLGMTITSRPPRLWMELFPECLRDARDGLRR
jgi:hypothetical protein